MSRANPALGSGLRAGVACFLVLTLPVFGVARAEEPQPRIIPGWGQMIDPDHDCTVTFENDVLSIKVPGTLHDLSSEIQTINAPRVLREIAGDFIIEVRVGGVVNPAGLSTRPGGAPFCGAGLVLMKDDQSYVRLERAATLKPEGRESFVSFQERADTKPRSVAARIPDAPVFLRLERRGRIIVGSFSGDRNTWIALPPMEIDYPSKLRVGVVAINTGGEEFTARLEGFRVFRVE
jgi:hypothetical protein